MEQIQSQFKIGIEDQMLVTQEGLRLDKEHRLEEVLNKRDSN
jgi:hypothetical protein